MREKIHELAADGVTTSSYRYLERRHVARTLETADATGTIHRVAFAEETDFHQIGFDLQGGSVLLEPGAFQYSHGKIAAEVVKHEARRGLIGRMIASSGTGESGFATRFTGAGTVWTEPSRRHFILVHMEKDSDSLLLDDRAFYACTGGIAISTHVHRNVSGVFSGNGFMQPKASGRGCLVVESPVPVEEIDEVSLSNEEAAIDGNLMLMYSAGLEVTIRPLVAGLLATKRSGEGFVYRLKGTGSVWIMPTLAMNEPKV